MFTSGLIPSIGLGLTHEITIVRGREGAYAEDRSIYVLV